MSRWEMTRLKESYEAFKVTWKEIWDIFLISWKIFKVFQRKINNKVYGPTTAFKWNFIPFFGECLNFPPSSEFINKKLFRSHSISFWLGRSWTNLHPPPPYIFFMNLCPFPFHTQHDQDKHREEEENVFVVCVHIRTVQSFNTRRIKKVSASFPHSKIPLRDSYSTSANSLETKGIANEKKKLERDEGKKHFHVTSLQLILELLWRKSFLRIHETLNSNSYVSCCPRKGKH